MISIPLWAYIGTFYLIILTVQDYRNKMFVDDRFNFFMLGVTVMLLSHVRLNIWYLLLVIGIGIGLRYYIKKFKLTGEADANTFTWIFTGFGFMHFQYLITALVFFIVILLLVMIFKFFIFKDKEKQPFYAIILIFFILTNATLGIY